MKRPSRNSILISFPKVGQFAGATNAVAHHSCSPASHVASSPRNRKSLPVCRLRIPSSGAEDECSQSLVYFIRETSATISHEAIPSSPIPSYKRVRVCYFRLHASEQRILIFVRGGRRISLSVRYCRAKRMRQRPFSAWITLQALIDSTTIFFTDLQEKYIGAQVLSYITPILHVSKYMSFVVKLKYGLVTSEQVSRTFMKKFNALSTQQFELKMERTRTLHDIKLYQIYLSALWVYSSYLRSHY